LWLETISRTQASVSGGPDFAYDLCVRKIPAKERDGLNLSGWKVAFTGAERIRAATIERFVEAFGPCGFRREAFFPCYGLAEATLMVSGGPRQTPPTIVRVHADALAHNQVQEAGLDGSASRTLVGCGRSLSGQPLAIVDPQTFQRCPDETVGEIWVQGSSVSSGYYRKPEATQAAFGAHLSTGEGPLLRTGDLGFLRQGQLFVTGRLKDLIIIRGRNYYPEDIEHALDGAHPIFRAGYCAAFSIEIEERERLVVVQEIEPRQRNPDTTDALRAIQRAIAAQHELEVYAIVLAKAGEIPKTSSGKTQRSACRQRYLDGQLKVIAHWESDLGTIKDEPRESPVARPRTLTAPEIEGWLIEWIAARLKIPPARVRISTPFLEFGLSSLDAVEMVAELERRLGRSLSPTAVYNYPNIAAVARWLASVPPAGERPVQTPQARVARGATDSDGPPIDVRTMTEEELNAFVLKAMAKQEAGSNYG
jgi:acyl carrier protein